MGGGITIQTPDDSDKFSLNATFVVGNKWMWFEEEVQSSPVGHALIGVTVVGMEPKSDIGQDQRVIVDLIDSKSQGQDVLVELGHHSADRSGWL